MLGVEEPIISKDEIKVHETQKKKKEKKKKKKKDKQKDSDTESIASSQGEISYRKDRLNLSTLIIQIPYDLRILLMILLQYYCNS